MGKSATRAWTTRPNERRLADMRTTDNVHDRKVIIDDRGALHIGESLRDIGPKGTTITRVHEVPEHITQFIALWNGARRLRMD